MKVVVQGGLRGELGEMIVVEGEKRNGGRGLGFKYKKETSEEVRKTGVVEQEDCGPKVSRVGSLPGEVSMIHVVDTRNEGFAGSRIWRLFPSSGLTLKPAHLRYQLEETEEKSHKNETRMPTGKIFADGETE